MLYNNLQHKLYINRWDMIHAVKMTEKEIEEEKKYQEQQLKEEKRKQEYDMNYLDFGFMNGYDL